MSTSKFWKLHQLLHARDQSCHLTSHLTKPGCQNWHDAEVAQKVFVHHFNEKVVGVLIIVDFGLTLIRSILKVEMRAVSPSPYPLRRAVSAMLCSGTYLGQVSRRWDSWTRMSMVERMKAAVVTESSSPFLGYLCK